MSSEVTITSLWKEFRQNVEEISLERYRLTFYRLNIGFDTPSQDECGICAVYKNHNPEVGGCGNMEDSSVSECETCSKYMKHKERYTLARQFYVEDKTTEWAESINIYTVDMQKVLILPKMTIKNSFFVSRLVVFNETFAPLHNGENLCLIWHEAISG